MSNMSYITYTTHMVKLFFKAYKNTVKTFFVNFCPIYKNVKVPKSS